jgi:hypothetical protein
MVATSRGRGVRWPKAALGRWPSTPQCGRAAACRWHTAALRPLADHCGALGPGWPATATTPRITASTGAGGCCWSPPARGGDQLRAGQPQAVWRKRARPAAAFDPAGQPATLGTGGGHRQGPVGHRGVLCGAGPVPGAPTAGRRARRWSLPRLAAARIEAIIWTLKHQLGLGHPGGRIPAGQWARVVQRLLALNAVIWFNWQISAPVKRSLIAYDH